MKLLQYYLIGIIFLLAGCLSDAPRDNPLDSNNSRPSYSMEGNVQTYYPRPPRSFVPEAELILLPLNIITFSNEEGFFRFEDIPAGTYSLICKKSGFQTDTLEVELPGNNPVNFFLDGLPYFEQILLTSQRISHFPPIEDVYYIELNVTASDTDGSEELDLCWFEVNQLSLTDTLEKTTTPGQFIGQIQTDINMLHRFIGREFTLYIRDKFGAVVTSGDNYVTRIIEYIPLLTRPTQGDTVSAQPLELFWNTVFLPYNFHLSIEIMNISDFGFPTPIDFIDSIPSSSSSYVYNPSLSPGTYFWTLYITDDFGNSSRSREGAFIIGS